MNSRRLHDTGLNSDEVGKSTWVTFLTSGLREPGLRCPAAQQAHLRYGVRPLPSEPVVSNEQAANLDNLT